jgi:lipopolysaccharide transport system permease protein
MNINNINNQDNEWSEIIEPKRSLFDLRIKEIWNYKDLVMMFVRRDFVSQYKQTILGPIWLFIQPIFTTFIFLFVFNKIAKISTSGINPTLFYLSGITIWTYFADCLTKTSTTFISNANIFGKVYFPRLVTPLSIIISNLIKLGIQMLLLVSVFVVFMLLGNQKLTINFTLLFLPVYILIMAILGFGLGIIFSSLTTKYRDLSYLLVFGVQLFMYATPVIYPLNSTGEKLKYYLMFNPVTSIVENFRYSLFSQGEFLVGGMVYSFIVSIIVLIIGVVLFNQVEKSFMDTV